VSLTNATLSGRTAEKETALNCRIEEWDKRFSREVGVEIQKLTAA
jgi:hypothetical protein